MRSISTFSFTSWRCIIWMLPILLRWNRSTDESERSTSVNTSRYGRISQNLAWPPFVKPLQSTPQSLHHASAEIYFSLSFFIAARTLEYQSEKKATTVSHTFKESSRRFLGTIEHFPSQRAYWSVAACVEDEHRSQWLSSAFCKFELRSGKGWLYWSMKKLLMLSSITLGL